jgi:hypothetical protein
MKGEMRSKRIRQKDAKGVMRETHRPSRHARALEKKSERMRDTKGVRVRDTKGVRACARDAHTALRSTRESATRTS